MREITEQFLLGCAFICLLFANTDARAEAASQTEQQREQLEQLIYSVKGADLFRAHCAPCHGEDAKGRGPLASALKSKVPDLTGSGLAFTLKQYRTL